MNQPKYFIDQTLKRNGVVTRLTPEYELMAEALEACKDLNQAFPHSTHKPVKSIQVKHISEIVEEVTNPTYKPSTIE